MRTPAIGNLIRESKTQQIGNALVTGRALGTGGKSVRMRIEHGSGMQADICFRKGRIVFAECGEEKGVDVVYRVICWQDEGNFRSEPIRSFPPENVSVPTDYILLEGSRRLDEHQAGR